MRQAIFNGLKKGTDYTLTIFTLIDGENIGNTVQQFNASEIKEMVEKFVPQEEIIIDEKEVASTGEQETKVEYDTMGENELTSEKDTTDDIKVDSEENKSPDENKEASAPEPEPEPQPETPKKHSTLAKPLGFKLNLSELQSASRSMSKRTPSVEQKQTSVEVIDETENKNVDKAESKV